jgi:predicted protein tyrosine phosphatase
MYNKYSEDKSLDSATVDIVKDDETQNISEDVPVTNVSGHAQELDQNFRLLSICATGIVTGNTWTALGGAIVRLSSNQNDELYTDNNSDCCDLQRWSSWCHL